jgi:hypothetical protein
MTLWRLARRSAGKALPCCVAVPWLVESDLGHQLGEARVGAQEVGPRINIQVDEAVNAFPEGEVEQAFLNSC